MESSSVISHTMTSTIAPSSSKAPFRDISNKFRRNRTRVRFNNHNCTPILDRAHGMRMQEQSAQHYVCCFRYDSRRHRRTVGAGDDKDRTEDHRSGPHQEAPRDVDRFQ